VFAQKDLFGVQISAFILLAPEAKFGPDLNVFAQLD